MTSVASWMKHHKWNTAVIVTALLQLLAATVHHVQLGLESRLYVSDWMIAAVLVPFTLVIFFNVINLISLFFDVILRNWQSALSTVITILISMLIWMLSLGIDYHIAFLDP